MVTKQKKASAMRPPPSARTGYGGRTGRIHPSSVRTENGRFAEHSVVLIMVLAVLVILALLGVTFATLTGMERTASRSYVDMVQARLAAESGIHFAMVNTRALLTEEGFSQEFQYYGEDLDANNQMGSQDIEDQNNDGEFEVFNCPLGRAVRPSFMKNINEDQDADGNDILDETDLIKVKDQNGKIWRLGVSGFLPGTHKKNGDYYVVRVEDLSSRIYVNMADHPFLAGILENLAEEVGLDWRVGSKIYDNRPPEGYTTLEEIKTKGGLTDEEYEAISPYLTVHAWCDKKVVKPVPSSQRFGQPEFNQNIYTWETLRPKKIDYPRDEAGEIVGRAPVNINTAPREVLVALIRGLRGLYLDEAATLDLMDSRYDILHVHYSYSGNSGTLGRLKETDEITAGLARDVAEAIITNREIPPEEITAPWEGPFRSWEQFQSFCDKVLWLGPGQLLTAQQADVLKANFNPNSNINDFNPDYHRMFWVDKTDLSYYTTEFTFYPLGYFAIDSIGRILGPKNQILAEAEINTVVKLFEIYRESTQDDFLYDYWNGGDISNTIKDNQSSLVDTAHNLTLQTYPEILKADYVKDAHYDGYISLATVEHRVSDASVRFRAHYTDSLDADSGQELLTPDTDPPGDTNGPYQDRLVPGQDAYWKPGKLFPDGIYSEIDSVPMYKYRPKDLNVFTTSMWIKPHFFPESAAKTRVYLTYQIDFGNPWYEGYPMGLYSIANSIIEDCSQGGYMYLWKNNNLIYDDAWDNASFMAGGCGVGANNKHFEGGVGTPCLNHIGHNHESIIRGFTGQRWGTWFRAGKWLHIAWIHHAPPEKTKGFAFSAVPQITNTDVLYVNGQRCGAEFCAGTNDVSEKAEYRVDSNILRLGERRSSKILNSAPDSTLDEVIVWEGLSMGEARDEILNIYQDGRYYPEDDGVFTSREIDLAEKMGLPSGTPVTVLIAAWTQYVPESLEEISVGKPTCEVRIVSANKQSLSEGVLSDPGGSLIKTYGGARLTVTKPIRYQVLFRPRVRGGLNKSIVDSLIFDDITLIYYTTPRILSWSYNK